MVETLLEYVVNCRAQYRKKKDSGRSRRMQKMRVLIVDDKQRVRGFAAGVPERSRTTLRLPAWPITGWKPSRP
jgi:hypothetical protein